jgi:hypothetical protein
VRRRPGERREIAPVLAASGVLAWIASACAGVAVIVAPRAAAGQT